MGDDNAGFSRESFGGKGGRQHNPSKNAFNHAFWCFPSMILISISRCNKKGKKQFPRSYSKHPIDTVFPSLPFRSHLGCLFHMDDFMSHLFRLSESLLLFDTDRIHLPLHIHTKPSKNEIHSYYCNCASRNGGREGFWSPKTPNNADGRYVSKLMHGAKETANSQLMRKLEDGYDYSVDISAYSIKFQRCQFVKSYDDELAADEDMPTVLATKRFIVFRLCPDNNCQTCNYNYGEYLVDLETYLGATVDYQQESQEEKCYACQTYCNLDDDANDDANNNGIAQGNLQYYMYGVDCDSCYQECMMIENMEENGFIDATTFTECTLILMTRLLFMLAPCVPVLATRSRLVFSPINTAAFLIPRRMLMTI
jgi:hypothetical protein